MDSGNGWALKSSQINRKMKILDPNQRRNLQKTYFLANDYLMTEVPRLNGVYLSPDIPNLIFVIFVIFMISVIFVIFLEKSEAIWNMKNDFLLREKWVFVTEKSAFSYFLF